MVDTSKPWIALACSSAAAVMLAIGAALLDGLAACLLYGVAIVLALWWPLLSRDAVRKTSDHTHGRRDHAVRDRAPLASQGRVVMLPAPLVFGARQSRRAMTPVPAVLVFDARRTAASAQSPDRSGS